MKLRNLMGALSACLLAACGGGPAASGGDRQVNVYNWSDYIAEDTNANFEKATGIEVVYDVFDSNELLETKLLAGSTGYDVVVPTMNFLGKQIEAGVFLPLDRSKLPNFSKLDPEILKKLESHDPGNQYAVPYMWGTTGLGYNVRKVEEIFGSTEVTESLDLLFKPELLSRLKDCGVVVPDSPDELLPVALNWLGEDPNSLDPEVIRKTIPVLKAIRPYITNFHSSSYIDSLANGDTCLVLGWSGDVVQAAQRAEEAGNGVEIAYSIPKEGSTLWFDMLAIPRDAPHVDAAYAYINYLLDPKVMAENSNYIWYPNAVPESKPLINPEITGDPSIYPTPEVEARLYTSVTLPPEINDLYNRIWTEIKTSR